MNHLSNISKVIIVGITAAALIVIMVVYGTGSGGQLAPADNYAGSSGTALNAASPTQTQATGAVSSTVSSTIAQTKTHPNAPAVKTPTPPTPPTIYLITPTKNDAWKIGTQNMISWNKSSGITGSISLIDAATQQFVGVISPQLGPNQTSYTWNTRDLLLDRSNPLGKDVVPGSYEIELGYDGNNIQPIMSPVFTITN